MNFFIFFKVMKISFLKKNLGYNPTSSAITRKILVCDMESCDKNFKNVKKNWKNSYEFWKIYKFI